VNKEDEQRVRESVAEEMSKRKTTAGTVVENVDNGTSPMSIEQSLKFTSKDNDMASMVT